MSAAPFAYLDVIYSFGPPNVTFEFFVGATKIVASNVKSCSPDSSLKLCLCQGPRASAEEGGDARILQIAHRDLSQLSGFAIYPPLSGTGKIFVPISIRFPEDFLTASSPSFRLNVGYATPSPINSPNLLGTFMGSIAKADLVFSNHYIKVDHTPVRSPMRLAPSQVSTAPWVLPEWQPVWPREALECPWAPSPPARDCPSDLDLALTQLTEGLNLDDS